MKEASVCSICSPDLEMVWEYPTILNARIKTKNNAIKSFFILFPPIELIYT
jgi:hypothetical protein